MRARAKRAAFASLRESRSRALFAALAPPHPALRATFSRRREKGFTSTPLLQRERPQAAATRLRRGKLHLCSADRIARVGAAGQRVGRQVPGDGLQVAPDVAEIGRANV